MRAVIEQLTRDLDLALQSHSRSMEKFEISLKIGEGAYGVVYKATNKISGETVALKQLCYETEEQGVPSATIREIALLKDLTHPNVVRLDEVICHAGKIFMVLEFVDEDLRKFLNRRLSEMKFLSSTEVKSFMFQLVRGADFCHGNGVLHRDLKPQNLLIDRYGRLKLADFGLARVYATPFREFTHKVVTLWYRAPELLFGEQTYSTSVDTWSIGCVFAELVNCRPLLPGTSEIDQIHTLFRALGSPYETIWPGVLSLQSKFDLAQFPVYEAPGIRNLVSGLNEAGIDMLQKMLVYDPKARVNCDECLCHPYFSDFDSSSLDTLDSAPDS